MALAAVAFLRSITRGRQQVTAYSIRGRPVAELEEGFKLIGISGLTGTLQGAYGTDNIKPVRSRLDKIAQARNRIVHEADLVRHKRGGKPRLHPITLSDVRKAMDFLDDLVTKLEAVSASATVAQAKNL